MKNFATAFLSRIGLTSLLTCSVFILYGQARSTRPYFDMITKDSVKLYYSDLYTFTSKECAAVTRYSRMTINGNFDGPFLDVSADTLKRASGRYDGGTKNGYFEEYYANGKPRSKGIYREGKPYGEWTFFHENGLPERQLKITDTDTTLVMQTTAKGDILVSQGEGTFDGEIEGMQNTKGLVAKGKIVGGKPSGKWKAYYANTNPHVEYAREEYTKGKMTHGQISKAAAGEQRDYCCQPFISLFLTPPLVQLETFHFTSCREVRNTLTKGATLKSKPLYDNLILKCLNEKRYFQYGTGSVNLKLRFVVDEQGIPKDFTTISSPNATLTSRLVYEIRQRLRWIPAEKNKKPAAQVLFLNVQYMDNGTGFNYTYWLSAE